MRTRRVRGRRLARVRPLRAYAGDGRRLRSRSYGVHGGRAEDGGRRSRKLDGTQNGFLALVGARRARRLERRRDSACGLWPDLSIAYVNPGWLDFARRNGGYPAVGESWCEGARLLDAIDRPLRIFYEQHLLGVLASGEPWTHEYECSSGTLYRRFRMRAEQVAQGEALLLVHTRVLALPHDERTRPALAPHPELYQDEDGLLTQCIHCRRMRRVGPTGQWDWVPFWVDNVPENASGGLCPDCVARFYPDLGRTTA